MEEFPFEVINNDENMARLPNESILDYTQRIRVAIVEKNTANGLPSDPDELSALAGYLNDMDKQELAKVKIQLEDKAQQSDRKAQEIIQGILNMVGNQNPYDAGVNTGRVVEHKGDLAEVQLVPGELDHNQRTLDYDSFIKEYREKNPKVTDDDEE